MNAINIEGTSHTPKVVLDKEKEIFEISGQSLPENVASFFAPIFEWLDEYANNPNENSIVTFQMEYFNTASSKMIYEILNKFDELFNKGNNVKIIWKFDEEDEDMEEAGEEYADMIDVPVELVSYTVD
ncbi:MAG: DUF1987 domain-containing protein [Chlorobi bacterium]|nr:DUF1987 domain-containing protein [Chlorobiota bacterium]